MQKRMITCKHCGERISPEEEKCPFCNKKLEVDYASLYPAYPNKKYYIFIPNSLGGKLAFLFVFLIMTVGCLAVFFAVWQSTAMKPGAWLVIIPIGCPWLFIALFFAFLIVESFCSYVIWDGGETIIIKKFRGSKRVSISSISNIVKSITVNYKGVANVRYIIVTDDNTPILALQSDIHVRNLFLHFGIKEISDNDMKYSYYREKMFRK